jgi:hypothetical protein
MVVHILRRIPASTGRCPVDLDESRLEFKVDAVERERILRMVCRTAEETFTDTAMKLLDLEKRETGASLFMSSYK